jgi:thiamine-phosphate pyrophosphorylase
MPLLHVVATDEVVAAEGFCGRAAVLLEACREDLALHLRLRNADGRTFYHLAAELSGIARETGGWCVINGRVDVALTAGAQAVQLGSGALPVRAVRSLVGDGVAIGVSVHTLDEALAAAAAGADYTIAGAVYPTATHPGRPVACPDLVGACAEAGVPVVGIGGIDEGNAQRVVAAGAVGVAVVRAVWSAPDSVAAAMDLVRRVRHRCLE